jgi:hypothetical protein
VLEELTALAAEHEAGVERVPSLLPAKIGE